MLGRDGEVRDAADLLERRHDARESIDHEAGEQHDRADAERLVSAEQGRDGKCNGARHEDGDIEPDRLRQDRVDPRAVAGEL